MSRFSPQLRRLLGLACGIASPLLAQPTPVRSPAALDSLITATMQEAGIVGAAAALLVDREVVWMRGYGHADVERQRPFTPATPMAVASISKTITGVAMMRAVQEGRLSLDADVSRYLPFAVRHPRHPAATITLRHLATHTSSITDRLPVYLRTYRWGNAPVEPLGVFLRGYFTPGGRDYDVDNFLAEAPGSARAYSNIGASLAGYIVERVTGESLPRYTQRHIFTPLGMTDTWWSPNDGPTRRPSTLFVSQNGHRIPLPPYRGTTYPDGGVRTSVADLSRLFVALLRHGQLGDTRILDSTTAEAMLRFQFPDSGAPAGYGAGKGNSGLFWRTKFSGRRMGHGGNDPGVQTEMLSSLTRDVGVILFLNTSLGPEDARATDVLFTALWDHAEAIKAGRVPRPPAGARPMGSERPPTTP